MGAKHQVAEGMCFQCEVNKDREQFWPFCSKGCAGDWALLYWNPNDPRYRRS